MNGIIKGFAPLSAPEPLVLILGSMPSRESLKQGMYYSHPQNRFFKILFEYFGAEYSADIFVRERLIKDNRLALYDVIAECRRDNSSLDSKIREEKAGDIAALLRANPTIKAIILNGKKAEQAFYKYNKTDTAEIIALPSTSPANAACKYGDLYALYKNMLDRFL